MASGALASIVLLLVGNRAWTQMECQSPILMPQIRDAFRLSIPIERWELQRLLDLGVYHERSIPMYLVHLRDLKNDKDLAQLLSVVTTIDKHTKLFLPFALKGMAGEKYRASCLGFLTCHGTTTEAKRVAVMLLTEKLSGEDVRNILFCLSHIGGKEEIAILNQFITKSIADVPNLFWKREVDPCIKAIEERLASEAKGIKTPPYRHVVKTWKPK